MKDFVPTMSLRWYECDDRGRSLQQWWMNPTGKGPQGEWRDVPVEDDRLSLDLHPLTDTQLHELSALTPELLKHYDYVWLGHLCKRASQEIQDLRAARAAPDA